MSKWLVALLISLPAVAREQLGELKIDDLVIRPQFRLLEPAHANFELGESLFSVRWAMDTRTSAVFTVGSLKLLGTSVHFADDVTEELGFIEAYGEYTWDYGTIRAGLQPVGFGYEGNVAEADLDMPRSLVYQRRLAPLRDIGISYAIEHNGFFTRFMVHNGESGPNEDGRPWYTARWGWGQRDRLRVGFAGQTGTTKSESTTLAPNDDLAGVDPTQTAQWRMGGPFVIWTPGRWRAVLETYLGELVQDEKLTKYSVGNLSISYTGKTWFTGFRYDQFDPNHDLTRDLQRNVSLVFGLLSDRRTSRLFLVGTKVFEETNQRPNDELLLIWHLTPEVPVSIPEI